MPGPQLPPLDLTLDERRDLTALVRRHTAPQQLVLRARIILLAADGLNNSQIARTLGLEADTVRLWRQRWRTWQDVALTDRSVEERLTDAPRRAARPGSPRSKVSDPPGAEAPAPPRAAPSGPAARSRRRSSAAGSSPPGRHAARLLTRWTSSPT
jgi:hypothetical protein